MHRTFCRIYWRNWRKYLPGKICCPSLPWRRRSVMPLMNIMPFVTSSKEVIRLSITTILRESSDTALDNNYIERIQRYISLSRRNSMFFGSHEGAGRAAILYSIAISCRQNGINLFEYICDVIEKTAEWQPNTPWEKYRDLLPDRWKKQQQH